MAFSRHTNLAFLRTVFRSFVQNIGAVSSAGRALPWHGRGQRFDPVTVHHKRIRLRDGFFYFEVVKEEERSYKSGGVTSTGYQQDNFF
jgi:hypothetical protein